MPISETYNEDCMVGMGRYPDKFFDLAIVDPPYGINVSKLAYTQFDGRMAMQDNGSRLLVKKKKYQHKNWDSAAPTEDYFKELIRISKHQIIWGVNYQNVLLKGGRIVWNKCQPEGVSFSDCEIAYCSLHERVRLFTFMWAGMFQGKSMNSGDVQQGNKKLNEERIHPTQKPVQLYKWILKNYAKQRDKILDTHLGSGSSRIAAYDMGFDFYGFEIDKNYFDAQEKRFREQTAQLKLIS